MDIRDQVETFVEKRIAEHLLFTIAQSSSTNKTPTHSITQHSTGRIIDRNNAIKVAVQCLVDGVEKYLKEHPPKTSRIHLIIGSRNPGTQHTNCKRFSVVCDDGVVHKRCDDCGGSGWYIGLVERRCCPTCDGSGYL